MAYSCEDGRLPACVPHSQCSMTQMFPYGIVFTNYVDQFGKRFVFGKSSYLDALRVKPPTEILEFVDVLNRSSHQSHSNDM